ncbi:uncharacterized protein [Epargyreus clarus]|uniref:uncharacterized protein n=1 Tax=Epargyreus clarus TaxID=520877 RepID=UPI003C2C7089
MEFFKLGIVIFSLLIIAHEVSMEKLEEMLLHRKELNKKMTKRQTQSEHTNTRKIYQFLDFAEEKFIQHSQALEHLLKLVTSIVEAISSLSENLSRNVVEPKFPERIKTQEEIEDRDILKGTRRSGDTNEDDGDCVWVRR